MHLIMITLKIMVILCMQDMSLTTAKLTNLDLLNCGELYSLSFPELDQALGQQLVSPTAAALPKRRPKVTRSFR